MLLISQSEANQSVQRGKRITVVCFCEFISILKCMPQLQRRETGIRYRHISPDYDAFIDKLTEMMVDDDGKKMKIVSWFKSVTHC